jgi:tight adherence protein B
LTTTRLSNVVQKWRARVERREAPQLTVSAAALRAAALLRGGVPSFKVWRLIGDDPDAPPDLIAVAQRLDEGGDVPQALCERDTPGWRVLAAAWSLSEVSGAPLAPVLERLAAALVSLDRLAERRAVLLAGPRSTIRLVASLPLASLLLGLLLGFDPIGVLMTPLGAVLAVMGLALLCLGVRWANLLTARLADAAWVSGLECELCWVALSGGATPTEALRRVADSAEAFGAHWVQLSELRRDGAPYRVLTASMQVGTPVGPMLLAESDAARARAMTRLESEAEKLGVRVLLPIATCVLPSFVLLGVLPLLIAVLGSLHTPM